MEGRSERAARHAHVNPINIGLLTFVPLMGEYAPYQGSYSPKSQDKLGEQRKNKLNFMKSEYKASTQLIDENTIIYKINTFCVSMR